MYDPIMNDDTMLGAAQRAEEDRSYRKIGKQVVEDQKFTAKAAPLVQEARVVGEQVGARNFAQELAARIQAQREAQMQQELAQRQSGFSGMPEYM